MKFVSCWNDPASHQIDVLERQKVYEILKIDPLL